MEKPHKARRAPKGTHNKSYALTLEPVKEPKSLHQHSCVWNANPTKSQASMACNALSHALSYALSIMLC